MRASASRGLPLRSLRLTLAVVLTWSAVFAMLPHTTAHAAEGDDACEAGGGDPADEKKLKAVAKEREKIQQELNKLLDTGDLLVAEIESTDAKRKALEEQRRVYDEQAGAAADELASRVRRSYMLRNSDPVLSMLSATDATDLVEQSRMLDLLAEGSQAHLEAASSAVQRTTAAADQAETIGEQLQEMRSQFDDIEQRKAKLLAQAEETEARVSAKVALQRAANGSGCPLPPGQLSGGLACPVDQPRSYTDTWGAARSGGRSHKGVDILAPIGTAIRAYEDGTVSRMNNSSLGGISLYLSGASGNEYYYTHLSGYVSGISAGDKVVAGQHIAHTGDTGNARGIPHLHWEVRPGGSGNVNPYPYAHAACG